MLMPLLLIVIGAQVATSAHPLLMPFNIFQDLSDLGANFSDGEDLFPAIDEEPVPKPGFSLVPLHFFDASQVKPSSANTSALIIHTLPYTRIPKSLTKHTTSNTQEAHADSASSERCDKVDEPISPDNSSNAVRIIPETTSIAMPEEPTVASDAPEESAVPSDMSLSPHSSQRVLDPFQMAINNVDLLEDNQVPDAPLLMGDEESDLTAESDEEIDHSKLCPWHWCETEDFLLVWREGWDDVKKKIWRMEKGIRDFCKNLLVREDADGPRYHKDYVIWQEVTARVETEGLSKFLSVGTQMSAFSGYGAGYYGKRGYDLIDSELQRMLPQDYLAGISFKPLDANVFHHFVFIQIIAMQLIRDDQTLDQRPAIKVLWESSRYGNEKFPLENEESVVKTSAGKRKLEEAGGRT
ncbi:hypothetical protein D9758_014640 [Tetrapyrgos nigripes]|uniref:Restriction of telomere capping protein 4 C-terminal domain-containing protein n=1 Tax=Tetrapyrgos nigripes TaxID=182062 RepID=A0A8H5FSN4_9AGAR|nr:hypothetical protein D9758_014640 [Tetrapyrgos nigripes]